MPPEQVAASSEVTPAVATLATGEQPVAQATAAGDTDAAAKAEAERVAALSPEAKAAEETAAKAKAEADTKAKEEADAKAETERRAKLTPEQREAEDKAKAEAEAKAKADQVPEKYELKTPEGITLDAEVSGEFEAAAKEMGLSQAKAQKLFDIGVKSVQKNTTALVSNVKALQDSWLEASKTDKEFGGDNLAKNVAIAQTALKFATPELKKILNESRLGDHPEMVRWMFRVGKAMAEDTFATGSKPMSRDETEAARAKRLYPNQN